MDNLKYIAYINPNTGKIVRLTVPQYKADPEGLDQDGHFVVHVTSANLPENCDDLRYFMDNHWYNTEEHEFLFVGQAVQQLCYLGPRKRMVGLGS